MLEDDSLATLLPGDVPQPPLDLLDQPDVYVLVGGLQHMPPLLWVVHLPAEASRVVYEVNQPLEPCWFDIFNSHL